MSLPPAGPWAGRPVPDALPSQHCARARVYVYVCVCVACSVWFETSFRRCQVSLRAGGDKLVDIRHSK